MEYCVRALVVLPTKDLAFQVYQVFKQYISSSDLKIICLGNTALEKEKSKLTAFGNFIKIFNLNSFKRRRSTSRIVSFLLLKYESN